MNQGVSYEILSNFYVKNMNYLNCKQLKVGKEIEKLLFRD